MFDFGFFVSLLTVVQLRKMQGRVDSGTNSEQLSGAGAIQRAPSRPVTLVKVELVDPYGTYGTPNTACPCYLQEMAPMRFVSG